MMAHRSRRPGRFALAVPLALALAFPGTAHARHVKGVPADDVPTGAPAATCSGTPSAPLVVDARVFTGVKKGVIGNSIVISTKLTNGFFTSFFDQMSPQAVLLFTQSPGLIPVVNCGDVLTLAGGKSAKDRKDAKGAKGGKGNKPPTSGGGMGNVAVVYRALKAEWPPQSVVVLAVVSVDASGGTVEGFVTVQVDKIRASGNPKYVAGTILSLDLPAAE